MFALTERFTSLGPWWVGVAIAVLDVVAIVRALLRGHGVSSTLAWIFAVLAFPGVGAVAYLLLANPSIRRTVRRRTRATRNAAAEAAALDGASDPGLMKLLCELTGLRATGGNRVELLVEDERAFRRIEDEIGRTEKTLWVEYYIVKNDETGHRFLDLLAARAKAGVEVRLLYDAVGSMGLDADRLRAIRAAGGKVAPFLPVNPFRRRWAVNLRNHRKLVVIDGKVTFTGGMNVGDEYSGRSKRRGQQHFRDSHLRIEGPAASDFAGVFADDWRFACEESLKLPERVHTSAGSSVVCPLPSGPDQRLNASAHAFFAGITRARRRCFLTTPYFIPDEPTVRALVTAAKSGVDVRVLVPAKNDVRLVAWAARSFYRELVEGGVRVFEYLPSMLHAKTMVIDDEWGVVGSANVDMRSFQLNFEIGAVVLEPRFAAELTERFLQELEQSREVTLAALRRLSIARRMRQGVARLLSPLL